MADEDTLAKFLEVFLRPHFLEETAQTRYGYYITKHLEDDDKIDRVNPELRKHIVARLDKSGRFAEVTLEVETGQFHGLEWKVVDGGFQIIGIDPEGLVAKLNAKRTSGDGPAICLHDIICQVNTVDAQDASKMQKELEKEIGPVKIQLTILGSHRFSVE